MPAPSYVSRRPSAALRGLLTRDYVGFAQPASAGESWLVTPTPTATVIVNTGAAFGGLPAAFVAGLTDTHTVLEQHGPIECVDLKLTPLGAYTLLGMPMSALTGRTADLEDVLGPLARRLTDRLAGLPDWASRFAVLDGFLGDLLDRGTRPTPEVARAWSLLVESGGNVPVGALAEEVGWSRRHLVSRFHQQVGLPPKTVARMIRFETLLRRLTAGGEPARTATECGYYDQSHMDRDFREFAGTTPSAFLAKLPRRTVEVTSVQYTWVPAT